MEQSKGSPEREVHSNTDLPKKNRNISNKQRNPTPTRTWGTTTKTTQRKYKEQITKIRAELNDIDTKSTNLRINKSRSRFFGKIKKNQQVFKQAHQEKKREDPNKHNQKWKRRDYNWYHRNTKDCKKLLQRSMCQEICKTRWSGQILRKIWSSKTQWRSRKLEQTNNSLWNWSSNEKTPHTQKPWARTFHRIILQSI